MYLDSHLCHTHYDPVIVLIKICRIKHHTRWKQNNNDDIHSMQVMQALTPKKREIHYFERTEYFFCHLC